ncbi:MAG: 50S ribosomal protein L17 [Polyangiaceae bacterium]
MRHRKDGRQFGRNTSHRRAMFRNLAGNLVTHERIVTTEAKAKELRRVADRLITKAKRLGDAAYTPQDKLSDEDKAKRLHVSRLLGSYLPRFGVDAEGEQKDLVEKVMVELSQRFKERNGGYTRIIKIGPRKGDGAAMSVIEFVDAAPVGEGYAEAEIEAPTAAAAPAEKVASKDEEDEESAED